MKNVTVYIGTIKKCLDLENYRIHGDNNGRIMVEERTATSASLNRLITAFYTKTINEQAILIKDKNNLYYQYKLTNSFIDNMKIKTKSINSALLGKPLFPDDLFVDENTLIPYYEEQPKSLSLRKLKRDILIDPRIKTGIEH